MIQYREEIYRFALSRLRNEADAQDAVQETFLLAHRRIHTLRDSSRLRSWLMTIAYRVVIQTVRDRCTISDGTSLVDSHDSFMEAVKREDAHRVRAAMAKLRPLDRDALTAYYFDGLSTPEMADRLTVPLGTVKRRLHDARRRLGALL